MDKEVEKRMQLMKENCIFCKIIKKEIESQIIFEDDVCLAILDINPATKGHILLMPKEHYMLMPQVPDQVLGHLTYISKYMSDLLKQTLACDDVSLYIANGAAAGQQAMHFMAHLIPRYPGDNITFEVIGSNVSSLDLERFASDLKKKLISNS